MLIKVSALHCRYISNDFTWCIGGNPLHLPKPKLVRAAVLHLRMPNERQTLRSVTNGLVRGQKIEFSPSQTEPGLWLIELPNFDQFIALRVEHW